MTINHTFQIFRWSGLRGVQIHHDAWKTFAGRMASETVCPLAVRPKRRLQSLYWIVFIFAALLIIMKCPQCGHELIRRRVEELIQGLEFRVFREFLACQNTDFCDNREELNPSWVAIDESLGYAVPIDPDTVRANKIK